MNGMRFLAALKNEVEVSSIKKDKTQTPKQHYLKIFKRQAKQQLAHSAHSAVKTKNRQISFGLDLIWVAAFLDLNPIGSGPGGI